MSSAPEQEDQPFDWKAEREKARVERRRKAREEIPSHFRAYANPRDGKYDYKAAQLLHEDLGILKLTQYKGMTRRQLFAEMRYVRSLELEAQFMLEYESARGIPFSTKNSIQHSGRPTFDGDNHAVLTLSTKWNRWAAVDHIESATIKVHISEVQMDARTRNAHLSMRIEGLNPRMSHASSSYAMTERRDDYWTYDQVGENWYLSDEDGLIEAAVNSGGLPALWPVLRRILREQEARRSPLTAMSAFHLKVRTSALRGQPVRLVTTDNIDAVGTIERFTLGRDGVVELRSHGFARIFVQRSKVRNIIPWEWRDNALNFTPKAGPEPFRSRLPL